MVNEIISYNMLSAKWCQENIHCTYYFADGYNKILDAFEMSPSWSTICTRIIYFLHGPWQPSTISECQPNTYLCTVFSHECDDNEEKYKRILDYYVRWPEHGNKYAYDIHIFM